ncbi:unconventional myosin-XVIIIa-like isoform X2 [Bombus huntii]|uniref:unconventional myosin-XVIIIa-like isoform X2 n=1 Tax=Bombus huntii TaxID=85661 RepID=UPI0021AAE498|nr:unconventional myosin-XVIIIa-like isoform X2 [Bombus huntii]XP_050476993.1 unconventional myosin-XVIIIa-like isoform X2 [Bombus huntii]
MNIEQQRKEIRKEMQQRDEELEDVRGNALKKVKVLESQLENEREERTILLREKHELECRLVAIEEQDRAERAAETDTMHRLKRDLKRTKALLRDAQTMLERSKGDSTGKAALRQLKNQLEDAECVRAVAVKAKQALEQELNETQASLQEALRQRSEAEDGVNVASRERTELLSQLEENKEELAEVLKKYRAAVQQVSEERRIVARYVVIGKVDHEMVSSSDSCDQQEDLANITRRKNLAKQQQQDVVDDICEFTEKDSVAGVRVVSSFRIDSKRVNARRTKRQGKSHVRNPSNNIDTKIRYTEDVDDEDDDGIVEDTMNVKTFEKEEIIVSVDGKLLTSSMYEPSLRKCHDAATTIKAPDKSEMDKQIIGEEDRGRAKEEQ